VTYALSLADRKTPNVTVEPDGLWIEYEGIVDHIDAVGAAYRALAGGVGRTVSSSSLGK